MHTKAVFYALDSIHKCEWCSAMKSFSFGEKSIPTLLNDL